PSPSTDQLARLDGDLLYRRVQIFSVNPFSWPHDASIVGASPCEAVPVSIPSAVKSTPIAGRQQLVDYLAAGEKPREAWRIGTEHEKFGIRALLEGIAARYGWEIAREGDIPVALTRDKANITLEPAGQLELSGAPL